MRTKRRRLSRLLNFMFIFFMMLNKRKPALEGWFRVVSVCFKSFYSEISAFNYLRLRRRAPLLICCIFWITSLI